MGREVPYCKDEVCDICGNKGCFDFMGDCICQNCIDDWVKEKLSELYG